MGRSLQATGPLLKASEEAARKLEVRLIPAGVRREEDLETAFAVLKEGPARGLVVLGGSSLF